MDQHEEWRSLQGYPHYEVSSLGRVRSLHDHRIRVLRQTDRSGYFLVSLYENGVRANKKVHWLVAEAFHGARPKGLQIRHLDGDPLNNVASNLRYGTQSENTYDSVRHGTHTWSSRTVCSQGHPFTPENTMLVRQGTSRRCRTCHRASSLASKHRSALRAAGIRAERAA